MLGYVRFIATAIETVSFLDWQPLAKLPPVGEQTESLGVAGPYVGTHNDVIVAIEPIS